MQETQNMYFIIPIWNDKRQKEKVIKDNFTIKSMQIYGHNFQYDLNANHLN